MHRGLLMTNKRGSRLNRRFPRCVVFNRERKRFAVGEQSRDMSSSEKKEKEGPGDTGARSQN
jgi:hypothetical protein